MSRCSLASRVLAVLATLIAASATGLAADGVSVEERSDRVVIRVGGELLTELRFGDAAKPYFYPLLGPGGVMVTRHFPMRHDVEDEERDHPHQRSMWFTHGDVNGVDFWAEGPNKGRVVQDRIVEARGGDERGVVRTSNRWVNASGETILTDERILTVYATDGERMFDYEIRLKAPEDQAVTFGDTKEGTMGIRLAESMRLKPNRHYAGRPGGTILQDTGARDGDTWGRRAKWTAYSGPVDGRLMTVAIFDHPENPRHPTWWHVRDYGLFAANPFGIHDFERKPAGTGDFRIEPGQTAVFRYRFLIGEGPAEAAKLDGVAADFARASSDR